MRYNIKRNSVKILALLCEKIDKYEFLSGEEILPPEHRRMIEQAKFAKLPLGKAFEKQTKTNEDQEEKQINAIEDNK